MSVPSTLILFAIVTLAVHGVVVPFPDQFRSAVGTTIPLVDSEPIAQSGAMYYDALNNRFRVDSFWMNTSRSIIANFATGEYSVLSDGECRRVRTKHMTDGKHMPKFGVPNGFSRHQETYVVRGVSTRRYSGVERGDYLQQVDYYLRNMTLPEHVVTPDGAHVPKQVPVLWRIQTQRSRRRELRAPDGPVPNWRWFGQPMDELVIPEEPYMTAVDRLVDNVPITMDFFDFVPTMPDPNVFLTPATCELVAEEAGEEPHEVHIFAAQRLLVDLSFYSRKGSQVVMETLQSGGTKEGQLQDTDL